VLRERPAPVPSAPSAAPAALDEVRVTDPKSLRAALAAARPGQAISLSDGFSSGRPPRGHDGDEPGRYVIDVSGTAAAPITLQGSRAAVLDGDGPSGGYVLHLVRADHWVLRGFTVSSGSKGMVLDRSSHDVLDGLHVTGTGAEGVHLRDSSSDDVLSSGGEPDRSDRNQVLDNLIHDTAAENIDVKEGTSGGLVRRNTLDGDGVAGQSSADSWIDVKGSDNLVERYHGVRNAAGTDPADCTPRSCGPVLPRLRGPHADRGRGSPQHLPGEPAGGERGRGRELAPEHSRRAWQRDRLRQRGGRSGGRPIRDEPLLPAQLHALIGPWFGGRRVCPSGPIGSSLGV
jgi:hypothetical protein